MGAFQGVRVLETSFKGSETLKRSRRSFKGSESLKRESLKRLKRAARDLRPSAYLPATTPTPCTAPRFGRDRAYSATINMATTIATAL